MKWTIAIGITLLTVASSAYAGQDEFVGFGGYLAVRTSSYSVKSDVPTVFVGEPVEVVLTVHNNTRQALEIGRAGTDWLDTVLVDLRRSDTPSSDLSLRRASSRTRNVATKIDSGRSMFETVAVTRRNSQALEPGRYHLRVTLPASAVNRTGKNDRLQAEISFEVKTPYTSDEQVDYCLHLAYLAKRYDDLNAEQASLEMAIQLHPASAPAHADLGQLWRKRGDCTRSRAEFERAIDILTRGGDPGLQISRISQEDWLTSLRAAARICGSR
jgi:hypothetical protein